MLINSESEIIFFLRSQKKSMSNAKLQLKNYLCAFCLGYVVQSFAYGNH